MIRAYVGTDKVPSGSGKTLSMMNDVKRFIEKSHPFIPYKIVSNTQFGFDTIKWNWRKMKYEKYHFEAEVIKDKLIFFNALCTRTDTIFMADEMSVWADEYNWKEVPNEFYARIKQFRKVNIHFLYTVQKFEFCAKRLREFTNPIIECSPFPSPYIDTFAPPPTPLWIKQTFRTPEYYQHKDKAFEDKEFEKKCTYKTKYMFYAQMKRTFPTFKSSELTEDSQ